MDHTEKRKKNQKKKKIPKCKCVLENGKNVKRNLLL